MHLLIQDVHVQVPESDVFKDIRMPLHASIVTQSKHCHKCILDQHQACLSVPTCMLVCQAMVVTDGLGSGAEQRSHSQTC